MTPTPPNGGGGQCASKAHRAVLRRADFRPSMSRAENVYDNAFIKSRFGTIKTELELIEYDNSLHARTEIGEHFRHYNLERRHSALGYLSPAAFEALNRHPI